MRFEPSDAVNREFFDFLVETHELGHSGAHGAKHWLQVLENGRRLTRMTGANMKVVELFALLHDSKRENEYHDPEHGARAANYARSLRGKWFEATDDEMALLCEACIYHSDGYTEADVTVQTCWDADRLDLGRVGITPDPRRLCTHAARDIARQKIHRAAA